MTSKFATRTLSVLAAVFLFLSAASAGERINAKAGGVAVQGYDVVAYFTQGEAVRGDTSYTHEWQGVTWQFANAEHLDAFAADPVRYAPRYGGFCSGGVALGRRAPIDPGAFVIIDGKLYLHYDKRTAREFRAKAKESIERADANWQRIGFTDR